MLAARLGWAGLSWGWTGLGLDWGGWLVGEARERKGGGCGLMGC